MATLRKWSCNATALDRTPDGAWAPADMLPMIFPRGMSAISHSLDRA
jgi:hypothetical protein